MLRKIVAVLALGLLAACGQPTATEESAPVEATVADEQADPAAIPSEPAAVDPAAAPAPAARTASEAPVDNYSPPED